MISRLNWCRGTLLVMVTATVTACLPAMAQIKSDVPGGDVVLRLKGGGFEISGALRAFDGSRYIIDSRQSGRMTLNASRYECIGEACRSAPTAASFGYEPLYAERAETVGAKGPEALGSGLLAALMRGYAEQIGAQIVPVFDNQKQSAHELRLLNNTGQRLASLDVTTASTTASLDAVREGTAALAVTDRRATAAESQAFASARTRLPGAKSEFALGYDGLAPIVAPSNTLPALSLDNLTRILSGELGDWYELGLPPGRIVLHLRDDTSAQSARISDLLLAPRRLALAGSITLHATDASLADAVARDHLALGLVSLAAIRSARVVNLETSCGLQLRPTAFGVKAGEYPLSLPIYLYAASPPREAVARGLLRFIESSAASQVTDLAGFISQAPGSIGLADQAERLAHATNAQGEAFELGTMRSLLADFKDWRRLSITFRLQPGATTADAKTRTEAERLAAFMQAPENKNRKIMLAGFTDADGGKFQANLTHSWKRAAQLKTIVIAAGGPNLDARRIATKGYGPLAPIACNDTTDGRMLNRRVEVWVGNE